MNGKFIFLDILQALDNVDCHQFRLDLNSFNLQIEYKVIPLNILWGLMKYYTPSYPICQTSPHLPPLIFPCPISVVVNSSICVPIVERQKGRIWVSCEGRQVNHIHVMKSCKLKYSLPPKTTQLSWPWHLICVPLPFMSSTEMEVKLSRVE